jgi:hypothetical protein
MALGRSMAEILSGLRVSEISVFKKPHWLSSEALDLVMCGSRQIDGRDPFGSLGFRSLKLQTPSSLTFSLECFILEHVIGGCVSSYRSTVPSYFGSSEVRRSSANMSHHCMPFNLWGRASWFGVTRFSPRNSPDADT